jgi:hypothetical protein
VLPEHVLEMPGLWGAIPQKEARSTLLCTRDMRSDQTRQQSINQPIQVIFADQANQSNLIPGVLEVTINMSA